jgi:hypothetical protein
LFFQVRGRKYFDDIEEEDADKNMGLQRGK